MSNEVTDKRVTRTYSEKEIQEALACAARHNGSWKRASAEVGISPGTIRHWGNVKYREDYQEHRRRILPVIRAQAAEKYMREADRALKVANQLVDKTEERMDGLEPRDLPGAVRNLATTAAIYTDKAQKLREEGQAVVVIHEHRKAPELIRSLKSKGIDLSKVIEGSAEDVTDEPT